MSQRTAIPNPAKTEKDGRNVRATCGVDDEENICLAPWVKKNGLLVHGGSGKNDNFGFNWRLDTSICTLSD